MYKKIVIISVSLLSFITRINAETIYHNDGDTLGENSSRIMNHPASISVLNCLRPSAPLIISGVLLYQKGKDFRLLKKEYIPEFRTNVDDITMVLPSIMFFGIKTLDNDNNSDWKALVLNYAASAGVVSAITMGLKNTITAMEPDGSSNKSFPSGHTAFSFMGAHLVYREYGRKYPWAGLTAYAIASATGIMRIMNDKHYLQDVLVGAGIGILSAEAGYSIGSFILKNGSSQTDRRDKNFESPPPLFQLSVATGFNNILKPISIDRYTTIKAGQGVTAGAEAILNFSERYGAVISFCLNSAPAEVKRERFSISAPVLTWQTINFTPEISLRVHKSGKIAIRAGGGYSRLSQRESYNYVIEPESGISLTAGINYKHQINNIIQYKLFAGLEENFYSVSNLTAISYGAALSFSVKNR